MTHAEQGTRGLIDHHELALGLLSLCSVSAIAVCEYLRKELASRL